MAAGTVVNKAFCNHDRVKLWLAILSLYQNTSCFDTTKNSKIEKNKIILWGYLSANRPPINAPKPSPSINTEIIIVIDSISTPKAVNNKRCQHIW